MTGYSQAGSVREESGQGTRQFATFMVADLFFGIEVKCVQEVLRYQQMTPVPLAPNVIEGLINLRGHIVTAIDLRRRLGLPLRAEDRSPMNVVVRTEGGAVSLLVDEIGDVLNVDRNCWEETPGNVVPEVKELICGVYKLPNRLLLALDAERTVEIRTAAQSFSRGRN